MEQQTDRLVLLLEDSSLVIFDWAEKQIERMIEGYASEGSALVTSESRIIVGTKSGSLKVS
jgi:hypothetical protein